MDLKNGFNLWGEDGPEYTHWSDLENYAGGARCWVEWPSALWHLGAESVAIRTANGQRSFDFSVAVTEWHKADASGSLAAVPAHRPFDWPDGPSAHASYLAAYTEDMKPNLGSGDSRTTLGAAIALNGGAWFVIPDPQTSINSAFIDASAYVGGILDPTPRTPLSSLSDSDDNKRTAGTYWDWSASPATERYLYWKPASSGNPDLSAAGLPELLFSRQGLPPDGTAFDLNLLFEVRNYSILRADRYVSGTYEDYPPWTDENPDPDPITRYYYDLAPAVASSGYMDTYVSGTLSQLVPVAPKARA